MASHAALIADSRDALIGDSPDDGLKARLDDPQVASSLAVILDHADLLAVIVSGIDGLIRRADTIGDSVYSGVAEIRQLAASPDGQRALSKIDVTALSDTVSRLAGALVDATPTIETLLKSPFTDPQTAGVLADIGGALLEGKKASDADPRGPKGVFALMKAVKDPDVSRGLGFMLHIAKAFGRNLGPQ